MVVKTLVVTGYGINCEEEVGDCFLRAGSIVEIVHLNHLINHPSLLEIHDILALPGGFSYGDHIACGKNFSNKIRFNLWKPFSSFVHSGKPVIGICNGYQILVKLGILPDLSGDSIPEFTFTHNRCPGGQSRFENRWVHLQVNDRSNSFWLEGLRNLELPVRHGEGRLVSPDERKLKALIKRNQAVLYYSHPNADTLSQERVGGTLDYPANPNGSVLGIAALSNQVGNVLGMMPHPEAYSLKEHYPNFLGMEDLVLKNDLSTLDFFKPNDGVGMIFFYNAVNHILKKKKNK